MDNLSALKALCNAICNTFYPDLNAMKILLFNEGIAEDGTATPKDARLLKIAITLVRGYVETSRSEGGVSIAIDQASVNNNILFWCNEYGLDAEDYLPSLTTIESGTNLW